MTATEGTIKTALSISVNWELKPEERYVYMFKNNTCPPLSPNQLSLFGIDIEKSADGIWVTAFVRSTMKQSIRLGSTNLLLLGPSEERVARKRFDLSEIGDLPPNSSTPWRFFFPTTSFLSTEIPVEGFKLAFELQPKHRLELADTWEKSLADEDKTRLQDLVSKLQAPKPGEVNFMGLSARKSEDGALQITLLIRNGSDKNVTFEQLPLQVKDASGEVIAKGGFTLDNLEVKANTSKPWTFIFSAATITKENIDFSNWKAEIIQQS